MQTQEQDEGDASVPTPRPLHPRPYGITPLPKGFPKIPIPERYQCRVSDTIMRNLMCCKEFCLWNLNVFSRHCPPKKSMAGSFMIFANQILLRTRCCPCHSMISIVAAGFILFLPREHPPP